jgi:hypothetical protein
MGYPIGERVYISQTTSLFEGVSIWSDTGLGKYSRRTFGTNAQSPFGTNTLGNNLSKYDDQSRANRDCNPSSHHLLVQENRQRLIYDDISKQKSDENPVLAFVEKRQDLFSIRFLRLFAGKGEDS